MKAFRWNEAKNKRLQRERGVSFEEMLDAMGHGGLLDVLEHPNQKKYKGQKIFIIRWGDSVYLVPFDESEVEITMRTIIPSRKFRKKYQEVL